MGIETTDEQQSRLARAGDPVAFGELVDRHRAAAMRVATVVLGTSQGADDVVQDATERVWRSVHRLDPSLGFRSWFLRAVANTARNDRRSRGRRAALHSRGGSLRSVDDAAPDERAISEAERREVLAALSRLDRDDRLVLALRHIEQLTEAEVATVLEVPVGTVKSRSSRAMSRLREQMGSTDV